MIILRNFLHTFKTNRLPEVLNILGLALSLAAAFIIFLQINYRLTYNGDVKDYDKIYRIAIRQSDMMEDWGTNFSRHLIESVLRESPYIKNASIVNMMSAQDLPYKLNKEDETVKLKTFKGINDFASFFSPKMLFGSTNSLNTPNTVLLPLSISKKLFGKTNPVGRHIYSQTDSVELTVGGVFNDFDDNNIFSHAIFRGLNDNVDNQYAWDYTAFIKIDSPSQIPEIQKMFLKKFFEETHFDVYDPLTKYECMLTPFSKIYLPTKVLNEGKNISLSTYLLICFGFILLIIATINFTNFKQAEMPMRMRSLCTQKIIGSTGIRIKGMLYFESLITAILSFLISLVIIYMMPSLGMQNLVDATIEISNWKITGIIFIIAVCIGIIAEIYPTRYTDQIQLTDSIKGNVGLTSNGKFLRGMLIAFQFATALLLIIFVSIMWKQSYEIEHYDYGYDKDQIAVVNLPAECAGHEDALKQELSNVKGVEGVAYSGLLIGCQDHLSEIGLTFGSGNGNNNKDKVSISVFPCDYDFPNVIGLKLIQGRQMLKEDKSQCLVNEAAVKLSTTMSVGSNPFNDIYVVGAIKNPIFRTMHQDDSNKAVMFVTFASKSGFSMWNRKAFVNVRISDKASQYAVIDDLNNVLKKFSNNPSFEFHPLNEDIEKNYLDEKKFTSQIMIFALLSVLISIIGVFGLTMYECEYRKKEIGIRRILGSNIYELLLLINKRYFKIITACFILIAPIAYYIASEWLANFSVKTEISWWIFALAYIIVLLIIIITVSLQSLRVVLSNPINSIKTE